MEIIRSIAQEPWPLADGRGNHRVIVDVEQEAPYVKVIIKQWRRRDLNPEHTAVMIRRLEDDALVENVKVVTITREYGELLFEATQKGQYAIYYMPYTQEGSSCWFPIMQYSKLNMKPCDEKWEAGIKGVVIEAKVVAIESRTAFDSFYPMEVPASQDEMQAIRDANAGKPFLVYPEERRFPIKMMDEIPHRWVESGIQKTFSDTVRPDEYYVFQLGIWAQTALKDVTISYSRCEWDQPLGSLPELTCFNTEGVDWLGRTSKKTLQVAAGKIQPLWIGVSIPEEAQGNFSFDAIIHTDQGEEVIQIKLKVEGEPIQHHGDGELWRMSRLRWINSTIGLDYETTAPYPALEVSEVDGAVDCLGRRVRWQENGLPREILSFFDQRIRVSQEETPILRKPVAFVLESDGEPIDLLVESNAQRLLGSGCYQSESVAYGSGVTVKYETTLEYDGHIETFVTVTSDKDRELDNMALNLCLTQGCSRYMMGMGRKGGEMPQEWTYKWDPKRTNNFVWIGGVNGGIHLKLKHTQEVWELYTYEKVGLPEGWHNQGKGGCQIISTTEGADLKAYTGKIQLKANEPVVLRYAMLITPLKELDSDAHWSERYDHPGECDIDLEATKSGGATVVNLHQGRTLNPYINYPFHKDTELKEQIQEAHEMGIKYKLYYTVRELTTHAQEFWAIRSLGDEVLLNGPSFRVAEHFLDEFFNQDQLNPSTGGPWVCEHLVEGYVPAWQTYFEDGDYDCSVATEGLSRWHNYYLEGLAWTIKEVGSDGIYLDGVGYDRQIMKRVRKVMNQSKEGSLIDFHSGNNFHPQYGLCNVLGEYMELMPSVDSLWIGEGFDYEGNQPDYWLTEVSGIPFGLMGDMLHKGGNKWRGMVFGMTPRCNWGEGGNPLPIWQLWESFDMKGCSVSGWWDANCPVQLNRNDCKATAYIQENRMLIAIGSWAEEVVEVQVEINQAQLPFSLESASYDVPEIERFQEAENYASEMKLRLEPGKGKIVIVKA